MKRETAQPSKAAPFLRCARRFYGNCGDILSQSVGTRFSTLSIALVLSVLASLYLLANGTYQAYIVCTSNLAGCQGLISVDAVASALLFIVPSIILSVWYMKTHHSFRFWKLFLILVFWVVALYLSMSIVDTALSAHLETTRI